jgi:hypothetical protein
VFLLVGVLVCASWSLFRHGSHGEASRPPDPTSPQAIVQPALQASTLSQKKMDIPGGGVKVSKGLHRLSDYLLSEKTRKRFNRFSQKFNLSPAEQKRAEELEQRAKSGLDDLAREYLPQN